MIASGIVAAALVLSAAAPGEAEEKAEVGAAPDDSPGRSWSLADLLKEGAENSPALSAARAEADAMVHAALAAGRPANPSVGTMFMFMPIQGELGGSWLQVKASQEIMYPGKLDAEKQTATAAAQASKEQARARVVDWAYEMKSRWLEAQYVLHALDIVAANKELAAKVVELGTAAYSRGQAVYYDVGRAAAEIPRLQYDEIQLRNMLASELAMLAALAGVDRVDAIAKTPIEFVELGNDAETLATEAVTRNPEVAMAASEVRMAQAMLRETKLESYPDFNVGAVWMLNNRDGMGPGPSSSELGVELMVDIPIWSASLAEERDEKRAAILAASSRERQMRADVRADVFSAFSEVQSARTAALLYRDTLLPQALAAMRSAEEKQRTTGDVATLIERRALLFKFEMGYLRALTDYHKSVAKLEKAAASPLLLSEVPDDFAAALEQQARTLFEPMEALQEARPPSPARSKADVTAKGVSRSGADAALHGLGRDTSGAGAPEVGVQESRPVKREVPRNVDRERLKGARAELKKDGDAVFAGKFDAYHVLARVFERSPDLAEGEKMAKAAAERFDQVDYLDFLANTVRDTTGEPPIGREQVGGPGTIELKTKVVDLDVQIAGKELEARTLAMMAGAKEAFADLAWQNRRKQVLEGQLQNALLLEKLSRTVFKSGTGMAWEVQMAEAKAGEADEKIRFARDEARKASFELAAMAVTDGTSFSGAPVTPEIRSPAAVDVGIDGVLRRRPEVRAIDLRIERLNTLIALEKNMLFPSLSSGEVGGTTQTLDGNMPGDGMGPNLVFGAALSVVKEMETDVDALKAQRKAVELTIQAEVQKEHQGVQTALRQIALYRDKLIPLATRALENARTQYATGMGRFTDVVEAQDALLEMMLMQVEAEKMLWMAAARLEAAAAINLW